MKRLLSISRYPGVVVFILAGLSLTAVAYVTVNLFAMSMANFDFLREYGWTAVRTGGLVQLAEIAFTGAVALGLFLLYKICETELVARYRRWQER
ncbi:MAG: hypothetical protein KDK10_18120 [Maritimibacter sp.]|nr:hypothetical protein [Maritimibacter sp.]